MAPVRQPPDRLAGTFDAGRAGRVKWGNFRRVKTAKNGNHLYQDRTSGRFFRRIHVDAFLMETRFGQQMTERYLWSMFVRTKERKFLDKMVRTGQFRGTSATLADRDGVTESEARRRIVDHWVEYERSTGATKRRIGFITGSP
jgi:hypothetical protein